MLADRGTIKTVLEAVASGRYKRRVEPCFAPLLPFALGHFRTNRLGGFFAAGQDVRRTACHKGQRSWTALKIMAAATASSQGCPTNQARINIASPLTMRNIHVCPDMPGGGGVHAGMRPVEEGHQFRVTGLPATPVQFDAVTEDDERRMPITFNAFTPAASWSALTRQSGTRSAYAAAAFSSAGAIARQGPHQGAQTSTTTGPGCVANRRIRSESFIFSCAPSSCIFVLFVVHFGIRIEQSGGCGFRLEMQEHIERAPADQTGQQRHEAKPLEHNTQPAVNIPTPPNASMTMPSTMRTMRSQPASFTLTMIFPLSIILWIHVTPVLLVRRSICH